MQNNIRISDITPERHELQEEGYIRKAQHRLMSSRPNDVGVTRVEAKSEQLQYLDAMASQMGLAVIGRKQFGKAKRVMLRVGYEWTNGWSKKSGQKPKPTIKRVSLRKPLDVGAAIRGRVKPKVKTIMQKTKQVLKPKPSPIKVAPKHKRKKNHTERSGKTMRSLRKPMKNGKRVFSFPDHVWKISGYKKRRARK